MPEDDEEAKCLLRLLILIPVACLIALYVGSL